jgi:hypothetical protein
MEAIPAPPNSKYTDLAPVWAVVVATKKRQTIMKLELIIFGIKYFNTKIGIIINLLHEIINLFSFTESHFSTGKYERR